MNQISLGRKKLTISRESLLIFLLCFPLIKPEAVDYAFGGLGQIYNIGRIISFSFLLLMYATKKKLPSLMVWLVSLLEIWVVYTTYINGGELRRAIMVMLTTVSLLLIVDIFSKKPKQLVSTLFCNFEWIMYINLFTIIFFPNGLYNHGVHGEFACYFLGFKNSFFSYCLVASLIAVLRLFYEKRMLRSLSLMIVCFLNVFLTWSASSIVALTVSYFLLALILLRREKIELKWLTLGRVFVVSLILDISLSVFNLIEKSGFVSNFIQDTLHKGTTMSGRTVIWGMALNMIAQKPFVGYGVGEHISWAGYDWYGHNQYIQLLLEGGFIGLLVFFIIVVVLIYKNNVYKDNLYTKIFVSAFCGLLVFYLVEAGTENVFYMFFILAYHVDKFVDIGVGNLNRKFIGRRH